MFRKEILVIYVGAFLLGLDVGIWNILGNIRVMDYHWQDMELLGLFRFSSRKTAAFLELYLFFAKKIL